MALPTSSETSARGELDVGLIATTRLVLSSSVLFIISPSDLNELGLFHILSALYTAYSAVLYVLARHHIRLLDSKILIWPDIFWSALLVAFSEEPSVAFLFLFPTLIATFEWSFAPALCLALAAVIFLVVAGFYKMQQGVDLLHHEVLLPPIYLLVFSYLATYYITREMAVKRRLVLLKELTALSNPRFGIDRTIGVMMERLRSFHAADTCLMIVSNPATNEHLLRRADRREPEQAVEADSIPAETAQVLLATPLEQAMIYFGTPSIWEWWNSSKASYYVFDIREGQRMLAAPAMNETLITIVDAESFISVPLHNPDNTVGRLYLTSLRRRAFSPTDIDFLLQVIEQIVPVIENIRLVDQLASSAAEEERHRLARDIHDNVIQSYIGFQIGLAAVKQKIHAGNRDIANDIAQLMAITDHEINTLRRYIHEIPANGEHKGALLAAVQRFAATFTQATHIAVQVEITYDLHLSDRLVAEVFQMIVEGLSNVRRHTHASCASIRLARQNNSLILWIINDGPATAGPVRFIPWSIAERAASLGGKAHVEHISMGGTQVVVEIPL